MYLNHEQVQESLPDYIAGSLKGETAAAVESHLAACADCTAEYALLQEMIAIEVPDPGDLFWQSLPKKVTASSSSSRPWWQSLNTFLFRPLPAFAAAGVIALLAFVGFGGFGLLPSGPPPQQTAQQNETAPSVASNEREQKPISPQIAEMAQALDATDSDATLLAEADDGIVTVDQPALASLSDDDFDELLQDLKKADLTGGDA
ncbi:MAG TPA: zf-HC2 domain-containing protein [Dissulfurispiraceae bacterium]|nr:zf-HC2 domain-containing protein [Dissulfurispiraceae bacterium]